MLSLNKQYAEEDYYLPDEKNNILTLISSIKNLLLGKKPKVNILKDYTGIGRIIFILLDGVGFYTLNKYTSQYNYPTPIKLSTLFPSTTAAIITSLITNSKPGKHGMLEWNLYIPEINMLIESIPFRPIGVKGFDTLQELGYKANILFKGKLYFLSLKRLGFKINSYIRANISNSCYSRLILKGTNINPYINITDLSVNLRKQVEIHDINLHYVYIEAPDVIAHVYGYAVEEQLIDIKYILYILKNELIDKVDPKTAEDTLLIISSDHGLVTINPKHVIRLNKFRGVKRHLMLDRRGIYLVSGSPRNVHLHVKEGYIDRVKHKLEEHIKDKAIIMDKQNFIKTKLLGEVKEDFINRIGDLIILPKRDVGIWFIHVPHKPIKMFGYHGGLSPDEMLIPSIITRLSDIK